MKPILAKLLRQLLLTLSGAGLSVGFIKDSQVDELASGLACLLTVIWSWMEWKKNKAVVRPDASANTTSSGIKFTDN